MRDNIHRAAPLPKPWKKLVASCSNPVTFEVEGSPRAEVALISDFDFSPDFILALQSYLSNSQQNLFDPLTALNNPQFSHPSERDLLLLDHFRRILESGSSASDPLRDAIDCAAQEVTNAKLRSLDGYLFKEAPGERPKLLALVQKALAEAPREHILDSVVQGKRPIASLKIPKLTPEEDLSK